MQLVAEKKNMSTTILSTTTKAIVEIDDNVHQAEQGTMTDTINTASSNTSTAASNDNESDNTENTATTKKWYYSSKLYIGLLLLGFIIFIIVDSATNQHVRNGLEIFLEWIEDNPIGGFFLFVIGT
jgi:hypothetical protein